MAELEELRSEAFRGLEEQTAALQGRLDALKTPGDGPSRKKKGRNNNRQEETAQEAEIVALQAEMTEIR